MSVERRIQKDKYLDKKGSGVVQLLIRDKEFTLYPLPKDQSNIKMEVSMAEVVANTGVSKDKGYLYYLGKDGNVWRSQMARAGKGGGNAEKVADAGVTRESGYLYFIDKNGNVARSDGKRSEIVLSSLFLKRLSAREPFYLNKIVLIFK